MPRCALPSRPRTTATSTRTCAWRTACSTATCPSSSTSPSSPTWRASMRRASPRSPWRPGAVASPLNERAIRKDAVVRAPIADVWNAWTTKAGIESFFAPEAVIDARPDGAFDLHFDPYAPAGMKGADNMRFLALQKERLVSFTWNAPPHLPDARTQRTVVVLRMEPLNEKETRVRLNHTGWGDGGEWDKAY